MTLDIHVMPGMAGVSTLTRSQVNMLSWQLDLGVIVNKESSVSLNSSVSTVYPVVYIYWNSVMPIFLYASICSIVYVVYM